MNVQENRRRLLDAARARMPNGFEWNFSKIYVEKSCGAAGCMIGLARTIGVIPESWPTTRDLADALDLDQKIIENICIPESENAHDGGDSDWVPSYNCAWDEITPAMVADKLEALF